MKFDPKDYIALATAVITVGSVVWKGGQITQQLEATAEAVRQMAPVVTRLDSATARLDARTESTDTRVSDLTRRVDYLEQRRSDATR